MQMRARLPFVCSLISAEFRPGRIPPVPSAVGFHLHIPVAIPGALPRFWGAKLPQTSWGSWAWEQGKRDLGKAGKVGFVKRRVAALSKSGFFFHSGDVTELWNFFLGGERPLTEPWNDWDKGPFIEPQNCWDKRTFHKITEKFGLEKNLFRESWKCLGQKRPFRESWNH